jgi:hypothetical protein
VSPWSCISRTLLALLALVPVAACGEEDPDLGAYFVAEGYKYNARCMTFDDKLAGRRQIRIFRSGRGNDVLGSTRGLQRYYRRHGLEFFAAEGEREVNMPYAVDDRPVLFQNALAAQFPGVDLSDSTALMRDPALWAEVQRAVGAFIFRPMADFARTNGSVGLGATNLALVPDIVATGWATGARILGLAISPSLVAVLSEGGGADAAFWKGLDLPADFTPMLFLHGTMLRELGASNPGARDATVAHEFGHTAGLVHESSEDDFDNLMYPSVDGKLSACHSVLLDDQLALMRRTLGVGPPVPVTAQALTSDWHSAHPRHQPLRPEDLPALLAGDRRPLLRVLAPLLHLTGPARSTHALVAPGR